MKQFWKYLKYVVRRNFWVVLILVAALIMGAACLAARSPDLTALTAKRVEKRLDERMRILDSYISQVLESDPSEWPELKGFPSDMVVYNYVGDTLKSWNNQFTLDNDNISQRVFVQYFTNLRSNRISPLRDVDTTLSYMNLGPNWYLVKGVHGKKGKYVIGGLRIRNTLDDTYNGINPRLKVSNRFAIYPISYSGGAAVCVGGKPQFKIIQENMTVSAFIPNAAAMAISVFLIIIGILLFLSKKRTIPRAIISIVLVTAVCAACMIIGYGMENSSEFFSPTVYAGGNLWYSLGAVMVENFWILTVTACMFMSRKSVLRHTLEGKTIGRTVMYVATVVIILAALLAYTYVSFKSIIVNSNINLELFHVRIITEKTVMVYISYLGLLLATALLLQLLTPIIKKYTGRKINVFSRTGKLILSFAGTMFLMAMVSSIGFRREIGRTEIWANRLSVDRDLALEIQLRSIENSMANDGMIPSLLSSTQYFNVIVNRINENYLSRFANDYDVEIYMFRDSEAEENLLRYLSERLQSGTPLAENSRFMYSRTSSGKAQYSGFFTYYNKDLGVVRLLIEIKNKVDTEVAGYATMVKSSRPGTVSLPPNYSYAKYLDGKLISYHGDYAYPTVFSGPIQNGADSTGISRTVADSYIHFISSVSEEEYVVISRKRNDVTKYLVTAFMLLLLSYAVLSAPQLGTKKKRLFVKNYYKQRINTVLYLSLAAVLVSMALVSVLFIYRRNQSNMNELMVNKINTIQSLAAAGSRYFQSSADFATSDFRSQLSNIGLYTKSDISIFSTDGKVVASTYPEIFERLLIGTRLNGEAYKNIIYNNKRYYIYKENIDGRGIYTMSAPVFNVDGRMLGILSAPYTDTGVSFKEDALFHICFVITIFLILTLLSTLLSARVVDKMFRPLIDMGLKMKKAKTSGLEYIFYDRDDEIAVLVESYNRMVHDLSESSKQAAQFERDKAWSEMARQVAHEIKNPLTPIKLQIQRIIRLKSKNDPSWQDKFDGIAAIILENLDQLTDTANEFSTFAKLYSEDPVDINLDQLATDQVTLFSDKEDISIHYIGLQNSWVSGPKPQLTRVFVNLLTNAVQAIEGMQKEDKFQGEIRLSIRNSNRDGFYDIVFEDNGPGVKDENRSRLFTPNFTTKSSGTGLGLSICKNILDRCGGEIFYSKSFSLGGACFTIRYPKK